MRILYVVVALVIVIDGCSKPRQRHHFVTAGVKDLPLILLDQDTGKICYAGDSPGNAAYLDWYKANVGRETPIGPSESHFYCSDVVGAE